MCIGDRLTADNIVQASAETIQLNISLGNAAAELSLHQQNICRINTLAGRIFPIDRSYAVGPAVFNITHIKIRRIMIPGNNPGAVPAACASPQGFLFLPDAEPLCPACQMPADLIPLFIKTVPSMGIDKIKKIIPPV